MRGAAQGFQRELLPEKPKGNAEAAKGAAPAEKIAKCTLIFPRALTIMRGMQKSGKVIGIDLGGTKVLAGVVNSQGKVLAEVRAGTALGGGWPRLKKQLIDICQDLQKAHRGISGIGIGSAGPLHAPSGRLLDPTNFGWS